MTSHPIPFPGRRWRRLASLLLLPALWLSLAMPFPAGPSQARPRIADRVREVDPQELMARSGALPVEVGMYIKNLHGLNLAQRTFTAEGYYWLEWGPAVQELLLNSGTRPGQLVEISNLINEWDAVFEGREDPPRRMPDGRYRLTVRFSANLYIPVVNLRDSPFDRLNLPIVLEINPEGFAMQGTPLVLVPESHTGALLGSYSSVDGFHIQSNRMVSLLHSYGTDWGLNLGDLSYSTINVSIAIEADWFASFINFMLPLLIVLSVVLAAPSLEGILGELRLAIPTTALFVLFLWSNNRCARATAERLPVEAARINRVDAIFHAIALVGLVLTALIAWQL